MIAVGALVLFVTTGFSIPAATGILHGIVSDDGGQPVTGLTAVVTQLTGQPPFAATQALTPTGEFVVSPTVGSYLIELQNDDEDIVAYRSGINIHNNITTFVQFSVDTSATCQTNLGHGSVSGLSLSLCGDDLTTADSTARLQVYNATPQGLVFMPISLSNNPTPLGGGTLVPFPFQLLMPLTASTGGTITLDVPGAAGLSATIYMQVVDTNGATLRFSNAIEAVIGF